MLLSSHITKTTTWHDPRKTKQYAPTTQQRQMASPAASTAARSPFFTQTGSGVGVGAGAAMGQQTPESLQMQLDMNASMMQQLSYQGMPPEPMRQRSTSWIDPRGTAAARNQYSQRHLAIVQARQRMLRQQRDLMSLSGMTDEMAGGGGAAMMPGQLPAVPDGLPRDPFMPVTGSVSPDMALQLNAPSPASSALSHVREGSTDSGFGLSGMEAGLGGTAGLDAGNQYDPMVGNTGLFSSFANHSMSPIPSVGSPRPASASSFLRQGNQPVNDLSGTAGLEASLVAAAAAAGGLPMDTDDLSAVLGDSEFLSNMADLDNDPMLMQTLL